MITSTADVQVRYSRRSCETLTGCTHITEIFKQALFERRCELCREKHALNSISLRQPPGEVTK